MKIVGYLSTFSCVYTRLVELHNEYFEHLAALQRKRTFEGKENHVPNLGDLETLKVSTRRISCFHNVHET